ncbi:PAXIP1-associated glutamate-rich protein 1-like [Lineus longissimus]|uniref:PAXIP1-associated glutamate-rich protein 1-like n=1 Tax=Lineus longissimus TaxID=88925 RepID=UPI002B4CD309
MMETEESREIADPIAQVEEEERDWCVPCSDEEIEGDNKKMWEPDPEQIIELYTKLCEDKVIDLRWKNPGRRPPESNQEKTPVEETMETTQEEDKEEEVTEFDFDTIEPEPTITPRRTPGNVKTPRTHRVARMDKILDDIFKQKKESISKCDVKSPRSPHVVPGPSTLGPGGDTTPKWPISSEIQTDPFSGL